MKRAAILGTIMAALFVGCASQKLTLTIPQTKEIAVEQMIRSVPLVFYGGSAGAGVLFKSGDKIGCLTAAHVLADGDPNDPKSTLTYGKQIIHITGYVPGTEDLDYTTTAKLVAIDPKQDWAVLEVAEEKSGMQFSKFARHLPRIGEAVWSIGSPMFDAGTISRGVVCHPRRNPAVESEFSARYIHTDAAGTFGSSGGGLFTDDGLCVGIVVRKNPMNDTMYAVPTGVIEESLCAMFLPPDPMPPFVE
jgi:S1-C subfamily serine protease